MGGSILRLLAVLFVMPMVYLTPPTPPEQRETAELATKPRRPGFAAAPPPKLADGPWIGVDLDGTLAHYDGWRGGHHIGSPLHPMVARVRNWLAEGKDVRIFTARVADPADRVVCTWPIQEFCLKNFGRVLPITATKDRFCVEFWDDRARRVLHNIGVPAETAPTSTPSDWS